MTIARNGRSTTPAPARGGPLDGRSAGAPVSDSYDGLGGVGVGRAADLAIGQRRRALRFAADLPYRDIGAALGSSEAAARRRVHDGLATLREQLGTTSKGRINGYPSTTGKFACVPRRSCVSARASAGGRRRRTAAGSQGGGEGLIDVAYATADSPVGPMFFATTPHGLVRVALATERPDDVLADLSRDVSPRVLESPAEPDEGLPRAWRSTRAPPPWGSTSADWAPAAASGATLKAIARVPYGETVTYLLGLPRRSAAGPARRRPGLRLQSDPDRRPVSPRGANRGDRQLRRRPRDQAVPTSSGMEGALDGLRNERG